MLLRALTMMLLAAPAVAQIVSLPPSRAIECMTPPAAERGVPEYPERHLERKDGAAVPVELVFTAPDVPPRVRNLTEVFQSADFFEAVQRHVQVLRVPCMPPGAEPVRLLQRYVFQPHDGRRVVGLPPRDAADRERAAQAACLMRITPEKVPEYPVLALRAGEQGNFLLRLRFAEPAAAPQATVVAGPKSTRLRASLEAFVPGYRLPCLRGEPMELDVAFIFRIEGGARTVINDLGLRRLVQAAEFAPPARFDFGSMGCPFDVRLTHYQPFKPHVVAQLGEAREERRDFIHWLSQVRLRLDKDQPLELLGQSFTVSVPCGSLDL
jgi:hypothetical protein